MVSNEYLFYVSFAGLGPRSWRSCMFVALLILTARSLRQGLHVLPALCCNIRNESTSLKEWTASVNVSSMMSPIMMMTTVLTSLHCFHCSWFHPGENLYLRIQPILYQKAQLSQRNRATRCQLVNCCIDVRKITFETLSGLILIRQLPVPSLPLSFTPNLITVILSTINSLSLN